MQATDSPSPERLLPWLRLALTLPGHVAAGLVRTHGCAAAALHALRDGAPEGVSPMALKALRMTPSAMLRELAAATAAWAAQPGNTLLMLDGPGYPMPLAQIADPPLLLHVQGNADLLQREALAIVGARNATHQGRIDAARFARALADAGYVIVSGLALGIDAAAHDGALAATGATVAVVGTGIDVVYPASNASLHARIRELGCIVSEFVLGTPPRKHHFPIRNRIISGLSRGVLVVEAAEQSGSLITARMANEQGRDVFALPGSIHATLAKGCHKLIRDGAKLVDTVDHVLEAFGNTARGVEEALMEQVTGAAGALLDAMSYDPVRPDDLAARLKLDPSDTQASLLALELAGVVERLPGGAFCRLKR